MRPELRDRPSLEETPELDEGEPADLVYVGSRFRADLGIDARDRLRVFGQIQDGRRFGTESSPMADEATLDLHQGYLELHDLLGGRLDLRAGRFEVAWGNQRMIGDAAWSDVGRSFDGGLVRLRPHEDLRVDVFGAWVRERRVISVRDQVGSTVLAPTNGDGVFGTFGVWTPAEGQELDAWVLGRLDAPTTTPRQLERDRRILSPGLRVAGSGAGVSWDLEGGVQVGTADGLCDDPCEIPTSFHNEHLAFAGAVTVGYSAPIPWKPYLGVGIDAATGDGDPADGDSEDFDNFFPSNHPYYGSMDLTGWRNVVNQRARLGLKPATGLALTGDLHLLHLQQQHGGWFDALGARMDDLEYDLYYATSRDLGIEVDGTLAWQTPLPELKASAGVSRFVPHEAAIERRGRHPSTWAFVSLEVALRGSTAPPPADGGL